MPTQTIQERSESWPENVPTAELREKLSSYRNTGVFARNKNNATPYKFYIRPFPNSYTMRQAIQDNGGSIIKYKDVGEADFIIKSMQHPYMNDNVSKNTPECSARLIIDSLEAGELLDYRDYVVTNLVESSGSSSEEEIEDTRTEKIDDDDEEEEDGQFNPNEGPISAELLMMTPPPQATTKTPRSIDGNREQNILVDTNITPTSSAERRSFVEETPSNSHASAKTPGSSAAKDNGYLNSKVDEALEPDDQYTDNFLSSQSRSFAELATDAAQSRENQEIHSAVISDNDYRVESLLDKNSRDIREMTQDEIAEHQTTVQDDARTTASSSSLLGRATGMVVRLARNAFSYSSPARGDDEHFVQQQRQSLSNKAKSDLAALESNQGHIKGDGEEEGTSPLRRDYSESRLGKRRRISQIPAEEEDTEAHTVLASQTQSAPVAKSQNALLDQLITTSTSRQTRRRTGPLSQASKQRKISAQSLSPEFVNRRNLVPEVVATADEKPLMKSSTVDNDFKSSTMISPSVKERASQFERRITRSSEKGVVELMNDTESDDLPSADELIYSKSRPAPRRPEEEEEKEISTPDDASTKSNESNVEADESTGETGVADESLVLEDSEEEAEVASQSEGGSEEGEVSEYDEDGNAEEEVAATEVADKVSGNGESNEEDEDSEDDSEDPELPIQDTPMKAVDEASDREDKTGDAASEEALGNIERDALDILMDDDSGNESEEAIPVSGPIGNITPQQIASAPSNKPLFTPDNADRHTAIHGGARTLPPPDRAYRELLRPSCGLTLCERLKQLNTKMVQDSISPTLPATFDNNQRPLSPPSFQESISLPPSPSHRSILSGTSRVYGGGSPEISDIERLQYVRKLKGLIMDTDLSAAEALKILYRVTGNWVFARVLIVQGEQAVPDECLWNEADDQILLNGVNLAKIADLRERKGDIEVYRRTQFLNTYYSPTVQ